MMKMLGRLILLCFVLATSAKYTYKQLHGKYYSIFTRTRNRNAASHLWATYVIKNFAPTATEDEVYNLFAGFCPVSGSPVRPSSWNTWKKLKIKRASNTNEEESGIVHVCCWPCICDIQEFVRVDTLNINTKNGLKEFRVLVIGDPCINPSKIPRAASEVYCENNTLQGATKSSNGHVVIGMLQRPDKFSRRTAESIESRCENRRNNNYRWGMGRIFVEVASINPITS